MPTKGKGNTRVTRAKAKARGVTPKSASKAKPKSVASTATPASAKRSQQPLSSVWVLTATASRTIWSRRKLFIGIVLVYGVLNIVLVQGLAGSASVTNLKHSFDQAYHGHGGQLVSSFVTLAALIGTAGGDSSSSQAAGIFQLFLILITSLAIIWAIRQVLAGATIRIRDSFYSGLYPLVPFILVLLMIGLQLVPLVIGSAIYAAAVSGGVAINVLEDLFWLVIFAAFAGLSLYLISSSIFATYIVTLPDMTPLKALRSARELVAGRRLLIIRKVLYVPVALGIVASAVMIPVIIVATPLAEWVFFGLSLVSLLLIHGYLYTLYRELLV